MVAPDDASMGAVPVNIANPPLERMRAGSPSSPRILAAMTAPMPWSAVRVVPKPLDLAGNLSLDVRDLLAQSADLPMRSRTEIRPHRAVTAQQGQRCGLVLLRVELGNPLLIVRVEDHEICVCTIDQPGAGANELLTMIGTAALCR